MASAKIVLFDIPSREPRTAWSPNVLRSRLLLNFKGIDYETRWVEFPDIKSTLENYVDPMKLYTVPAIMFPNGQHMVESRRIADAVEVKYPEPSLHLDSPCVEIVQLLVIQFLRATGAVFVNKVFTRVISDYSVPYFRSSREERFGMTLEEFEETAGATAFDDCGPIIRELTTLLKENESGPFFMGQVPSYADIIWVAYLIFSKKIGSDYFNEIMSRSGDRQVHETLLLAAAPWTERLSH